MGPSCTRKPNMTETLTHPSNIRKYVVLLQDCIAVKFVAHVDTSLSPSSSSLLSEEKKCGKKTDDSYNNKFSLYGSNSSNNHNSDKLPQPNPNQGVHLFHAFRDANHKCYWNAAIAETFNQIEYRGFILPSTIFISSQRKFLHVMRAAWARQMLRSPQGYRIEFIGDTEEILCEPIQQSHFSPLSDSLCWTILDMTSRGEEAFVETICLALGQSFPGMVKPSCELVYQTLEKLIRDRKVYQTSRGYFVVTPDTFRYMTAARETPSSFSTHSLALDALLSCHYQQQDDRLSYSRHSWDSAASADNCLFTPPHANNSSSNSNNNNNSPSTNKSNAMSKNYRNSAGLKRHNSLKLFRRKDNPELLGAKSLSFRLSKSKPFMFDVNHDDTNKSSEAQHPTLVMEPQPSKSEKNPQKKGKGLFSKIFGFRRSSRSKRKQSDAEESQKPESVTVDYNSRSANGLLDDSESGCFTLDRENHYDFAGISTPKWNSLPKRSYRTNSRRSIFGMVDDNNALYATPASTLSTEPITGSSFVRAQSSRSSTLSHGTSLGYGSQGPNSFLTSQSPCPNSNSNSNSNSNNNNNNPNNSSNEGSKATKENYKSYYELYRRRYPSSRIYGRRSSSPMLSTFQSKPVYETIDHNKRKDVETSSSGSTTTTTLTQNIKSKKNLAMELNVPNVKGGQETSSSKEDTINVRIGDGSSGIVTGIGDTQVKTIVNANGQIETHFDCRHGGVKSTIEIKASNGKSECDNCAGEPEVKRECSVVSNSSGTTTDVKSKINLATKFFSNVNFATKLLSE
ncbi:unnamed protein product [Allacma fusca]|uniref:Winged helix Storkhead-box1 domain-containing protein n=1 Tax=Allacma fusca TaxID=39272 RepID=A0A8J2P8P6_9HEXA|nr:unnamed protein product [Allacma fusca]